MKIRILQAPHGAFVLLTAGIMGLLFYGSVSFKNPDGINKSSHPRIVNIINFVRLLEPRSAAITEEVLYQTVVSQVQMMDKYHLPGTFLLQYDALMDSRYQQLFKNHTGAGNNLEIGAWWEIPQPLVEKAGLKWRGRYPWDWDARVDFASGYSTGEREKLADVYMTDFKRIFGYYPKSVGSWFIDAYTLNYLYKKYGIVASCNCKDQIGTDGYTLWGGYWNQAYYPSVKNAYMPAQNEKNQIPVPIFRMLGSDPVRQYDNGIGTQRQGVVTLEPVYRKGGGDSAWVQWYFNQFEQGPCVEYAYVQAGQENSFTWEKMAKGFGIQLPLLAALRDENRVNVETLSETGDWFRRQYKTTPPTSVTVKEDLEGSDRKTVWFNSRFYRLNLLWEHGTLRFRDLHLFNEELSDGIPKQGASGACSFHTLPFMDGYSWSDAQKLAGIRVKAKIDGKEMDLEGGDPVIDDSLPGHLHISWPLKTMAGRLILDIGEREIDMRWEGPMGNPPVDWYLELTTAKDAKLPFIKIGAHRIECRFRDLDYHVGAVQGNFSIPGEAMAADSFGRTIFRILPERNALVLHLHEN